jgi:hypothetical protein
MGQGHAMAPAMGAVNQQGESSLEKLKRFFRVTKHRSSQITALEEVAAYLQAQINIEPFSSNPAAAIYYERAMLAAIEELRKIVA